MSAGVSVSCCSMPSRLPLAITTSMPSSATLRAMPHLVVIPPRPNPLFSFFLSSLRSHPGDTSAISLDCGSAGLPVKMPSMLLSMIRRSTPIIVAISPESSSLSVNISSVTLTVSFSLTMGTTPLSSMTLIHARWLRYSRREAKFSFMVRTCPIRTPYSRNRS